ncbi:MAG: cell wall hydrolase [Methylobacterium frigidaeris]
MAGAGLLVSFTASAGYEASAGASAVAALSARAVPPLPRGGLVGPVSLSGLLRPGLTLDAEPLHDEAKAGVALHPLPQRGHKGDPLDPARVGTERRGFAGASRGWLGSPATGIAAALTPGSATWSPDLEPEAGFVPVPADDADRAAESSPVGGASDATRGGGAGGQTREDAGPGLRKGRPGGATPAVPRAVALSSTTPAPAESTPIEVAAAPVSGGLLSPRLDRRPGVTAAARIAPDAAPDDEARRRYADLYAPEQAEKEQRCLAEAVYFEARGESEQGQAAVAQVVLNRTKSGLYPSNICGVVYQNRHRFMGCQFSFACEGKSLRITDDASWQTATRVAREVVEGRTYLADVGNATHYHADYVKPRWSRRLRKMDVIGRHIFYQLKPGQT